MFQEACGHLFILARFFQNSFKILSKFSQNSFKILVNLFVLKIPDVSLQDSYRILTGFFEFSLKIL